jgi:hypothetical protein
MKTRNIVMIAIVSAIFVAATVVFIVAMVTDEQTTLMGACWPEDPALCSSADADHHCNMEPDRYEVDGFDDCPPLTWPEGQEFPLLVSIYEPEGDADSDEVDAVRDAIEAVNDQLRFDALVLDPEWAPDDATCYDHHAICVRVNVAREEDWMESAGTARHSWTPVGFGCWIATSNTGTSDLTHDVLRHEMLHCLGLAHGRPGDDEDIMNPTQRRTHDLRNYRRIRDADRRELRDRYARD